MTLQPGYDWKQDKKGRWRLWEFESPGPVDNWYREAVNGRGRLVQDTDDKPLPRLSSIEEGTNYLNRFRWGRVILGEPNA